jgi:hypothetical protein
VLVSPGCKAFSRAVAKTPDINHQEGRAPFLGFPREPAQPSLEIIVTHVPARIEPLELKNAPLSVLE